MPYSANCSERLRPVFQSHTCPASTKMSTSGPAPFRASRTKAMSLASLCPIGPQPNLMAVNPSSAKRRPVRGLLRRVAEENGAIGAKFGLIGATEQFVGRAAARFAGNVPQREVDASHGVCAHADATVVVAASIMRAPHTSMASGSRPSSALARPLLIWWESGASTTALTTVGAESTSPSR